MRKLHLLVCLCICMAAHSQISSIQTKPITFENLGKGLMLDKETNDITLRVISDNQFEDTRAVLKLGNNPLQAIQSLQNLKAALSNPKSTFEVEGYSFFVVDYGVSNILNTGDLKNTAGVYALTTKNIEDAIFVLIDRFNVKIEEPQVIIESASNTLFILNMSFSEFDIRKRLTLHPSDYKTKLLSYIKAKDGDTLTSEQKQVIAACINKGIIKHSDNAQIYVHYIIAMDSIKNSVKKLECDYTHYNGKFFTFPSGGLNVNYDPALNWGISECRMDDGENNKQEHFYLRLISPSRTYSFDNNSKLTFTFSDGTEAVLDNILLDDVRTKDESYTVQYTRITQFGTYARFLLNQEAKEKFLSSSINGSVIFGHDFQEAFS